MGTLEGICIFRQEHIFVVQGAQHEPSQAVQRHMTYGCASYQFSEARGLVVRERFFDPVALANMSLLAKTG